MKLVFRYVMTAFVLLSCVCVKAQDRMVAVLQHGDSTHVFYNSNAFVNALAAAESGDVITLSQGAFVSATITKAVKIIGASAGGSVVSKFPSGITVNLKSGESELYMEGVRMTSLTINGDTINDAVFKRCYCEGDWNINAQSNNCTILQCRIERQFCPDKLSNNLIVKNSILPYSINSNTIGASLILESCNIYSMQNLQSAIVKNCVIRYDCSNSNDIIWYNTAYLNNNFRTKPSSDAIKYNMFPLNDSDLTTYCGSTIYHDLTDAGKEKLIGTDGTYIGAYGGATPYTTLPAIPRVTSVTVPSESYGNGKLPVTITVEVNN